MVAVILLELAIFRIEDTEKAEERKNMLRSIGKRVFVYSSVGRTTVHQMFRHVSSTILKKSQAAAAVRIIYAKQ